jgi:hypothetical protein
MEKDLSENILHKIKEEKIKPKSRWQFILQDYVVWFVFFVSIISGAVSLSVALYLLQINDWGAYVFITPNFINFVLITLPYFWLIVFPIFLWISYHYFQHTRAGYRLEFIKIVAFNLGASALLGVSFYAVGIGRFADNVFIKRAPFYGEMMMEREKIWHNPEMGVVAGKIGEVEAGEDFELFGMRGEEWVVEYSEARIASGIVIEKGVMVKVFGNRINDTEFIAKDIKPLSGPGREFRPFFPELTGQIILEVK